MEIKVPEFSLVVLIGVSGAGKSSFVKKYFKRTEIISSDECRALVCDDANNQLATSEAFELLYFIAGKRLKAGLLTVIDATNVQKELRSGLLDLAKKYHCLSIAIVLDLPERVCAERNENRPDRNFGLPILQQQYQQLKRSIKGLNKEGFKQIYLLKSVEEIDAIPEIKREKLYNNKKDEKGTFDIIGDIHGCYEELLELLLKLGYTATSVAETGNNFGYKFTFPENRKILFLGDLVDRGPDSPGVLRLVMSLVNTGFAYCVPGNHDLKLQQYLSGRKVQLTNGLDLTVKQLELETPAFKTMVEKFLYSLIGHYIFDDGKLVVAHAGLKEDMQGRASAAVRSFCLYGETTGEMDEFGLPVRLDWAKEYRGRAQVVYGHTPVTKAEWLNNTINIDTGCVFGGKLTALRYPEKELVAVPSKMVYCEPIKPINFKENKIKLDAQQVEDDLLHIEDVIGKRIIETRLKNNIIIREENAITALEIMSRFAVNPKWLIYLPPTMPPCATSDLADYLEHPIEAFNYYKKRGVQKIICEEKHMGSRVVLIICKDAASAARRFGIQKEGIGICYTRTGRNFFTNPELESVFIGRVNQCLTNSNFWEKFNTNWVCLDAELMPWSAKAQALIKDQYAAVGAAAINALPEVEKALQVAFDNGLKDVLPFVEKFKNKKDAVVKYVEAYQNYCWPVHSIDDYKLAPFHILATEGYVHVDKTNEWHLQQIAEICKADIKLFKVTTFKIVQLNDQISYDEAINWWMELTKNGGEGMVVKPFDFIASGSHGLLQPAIKCRGKEYLRIIYGPEYDLPENICRLKNRALSQKQSLAIREFALGIEGMERFVRQEPLRRIHETVFGVLALESEWVDARL